VKVTPATYGLIVMLLLVRDKIVDPNGSVAPRSSTYADVIRLVTLGMVDVAATMLQLLRVGLPLVAVQLIWFSGHIYLSIGPPG